MVERPAEPGVQLAAAPALLAWLILGGPRFGLGSRVVLAAQPAQPSLRRGLHRRRVDDGGIPGWPLQALLEGFSDRGGVRGSYRWSLRGDETAAMPDADLHPSAVHAPVVG